MHAGGLEPIPEGSEQILRKRQLITHTLETDKHILQFRSSSSPELHVLEEARVSSQNSY